MWRSTVLARIETAERVLLDAQPSLARIRTELEGALESVLAAAGAAEDDPLLRARLEVEAEDLAGLARRTAGGAGPGDEATAEALREELETARRRLERVFAEG